VYRKPAYRKNTIALGTCLFGIGFIAFGNMAGNAINFAVCILRAGGTEHPDNGLVRGIAITCATLTCFIHAFSRRGGIWLNNMFALVKIAMLLLIVITAIVVAAHGLPESANYIEENTNPAAAFDAKNTDANGYAHAFLAVIFSFWGFEQPNYILGEISKPKRKFPIAMSTGVAIVCVLYLAVTISYLVVVPKHEQLYGEGGVAQQFFELSIGKISSNDTGRRVFNAFIAVSLPPSPPRAEPV
jgi:amino acid transporter